VPDDRFDWLCDLYKTVRVPAYLTVIDIAGLVKGAADGEGLGNAFLSHIQAVDGIFHVVRAFSDEEVIHVEGEVDPIRDLEIIHEELRLKDVQFLERALDAAKKAARCSEHDKVKKFELETVQKLYEWITMEKKDIRQGDWNSREIEIINPLGLLTAKTVVYLVNLSEPDYIARKNKWLAKIKAWIDTKGMQDPLIPFSGALESRLSTMGAEEKVTELARVGTTSNMPKIILAGYNALQLCYYFTAGEKEVRAWTIRRGTKAPGAAGVIHSDFERGFIMAEVMKYDDLKELGNENAVKGAGKYRQCGREYVVEDGDIIVFKFNVTASKKK